jgi:hypothetical protein
MGIDMKLASLFKGIETSTIKLSENQIFCARGRNIKIHCLYGDLWITWPKRGEITLKSGETVFISTMGKMCIAALSNAIFIMSKRKWYANAQFYPESSEKNKDTDILMN